MGRIRPARPSQFIGGGALGHQRPKRRLSHRPHRLVMVVLVSAGLLTVGRDLLTAALQLTTADLAQRAQAVNGLASLCMEQHATAESLRYHQEGLALRQQLGDQAGVAIVLHNMALTAYRMGDFEQAVDWLLAAIKTDPDAPNALSYAHLGLIAQEMGIWRKGGAGLKQRICWPKRPIPGHKPLSPATTPICCVRLVPSAKHTHWPKPVCASSAINKTTSTSATPNWYSPKSPWHRKPIQRLKHGASKPLTAIANANNN